MVLKQYLKEIKLALAVLCALVLLFIGINFLKGVSIWKNYSIYYVDFHDVTGLEESNAVYVNGFPVGTVRVITYDYSHPGNIRVKIEVDGRMHIPEGSHAELKSGLLGGTTMNIVLSQSATYLNEGDSIEGFPEVGVMTKIEQLTPSVEAMLPKVDSILTAVNVVVNNPALNNSLNNVDVITSNLKMTTSQLNILLKTDIPVLMSSLKEAGGNAAQLTAKLNALDYAATIESANRTLAEVNAFTESLHQKINSKEGSLGLLLNDTSLYSNLNNSMYAAHSLLTDLKDHPKRYVHFSVFGKKDK